MTPLAGTWWAEHGTHALLLIVPVAMLAGVGLVADIRTWLRRRGLDPVVALAAAASVVAAGVHVSVCPEHYGEGLVYGLFFTVTASMQLGWALLLWLRPDARVACAGLLASVAIVVVWALTRSLGIPVGPERGEVEAVGALDVMATTAEVLVASACAWLLARSGREDHRGAVAE